MGSMSIWHWAIVIVVVAVLFGGRGKLSGIMGDAAKGWTADQIAASFAVLTKDSKVEAPTFDGSAFKGGLHAGALNLEITHPSLNHQKDYECKGHRFDYFSSNTRQRVLVKSDTIGQIRKVPKKVYHPPGDTYRRLSPHARSATICA